MLKKGNFLYKQPVDPRIIQFLNPIKVIVIIIIIVMGMNISGRPLLLLLLLSLLLILFLPHQAQNPSCIADIHTGDVKIQRAQLVEYKGSLDGVSAFRASNEGGPDEAFEVGIFDRDESDFANDQVGHFGVVGGETEVVGDGCGAGTRSGENTAGVEVDSAFEDGCQGGSHGQVCEVVAALHGLGPGIGVEGLDVLEESAGGLERVRVLGEEGRGEDHGGLRVGVDVRVEVETGVDEQDDFEEIGWTADVGGFFETLEHGGAHAGGVERFG